MVTPERFFAGLIPVHPVPCVESFAKTCYIA